MIKIGILAPFNSSQITKSLLYIFKKSGIIAALKKNDRNTEKHASFLSDNGIEFMLILFDSKKIYPTELDVLILDNPSDKHIITYELIECITARTILIYNTDNGYLPKITHKNAVDYGFAPDSCVTVSSIDYTSEYKTCFMLCIQRQLTDIYERLLPVGEINISGISGIELESQFPAVICSLLCGIYTSIDANAYK